MSVPVHLKPFLDLLPDEPGIYKFLNEAGQILYIGKAVSIIKRVRSYFSGSRGHSYRISKMLSQVAEIRFTVTHNEVEALLLENNLIKHHQPKYNILLKDGKTYPYICIKHERFPRVFPTRNKVRDGSLYYGPYTSVTTMNAILELIRENFKLRTCNYFLSRKNIESGKFRLCLEYQIGNCAGPCEGLMEETVYQKDIEAIKHILKGNFRPLISQLTDKMQEAASNYEFETAEEFKRKIEKIHAYKRKNTIISEQITDVEVFTADYLNHLIIVNHLKVKNGGVISTHSWEIKKKREEGAEVLAEAVEAVIAYGFAEDEEFGTEILSNIQVNLPELNDKVVISIPNRGDKKKLIELGIKNCKTLLEEKILKQNFKKSGKAEGVLQQLQSDLNLKSLPQHIECFDNSNIQGSNPVASMVVFREGKPSKKDYRHFNIKTVVGADDFASMKEIITRRYSRALKENQELPDLIVIDGGKGQLNAASEALEALELRSIPVIGIAKRLEEIYRVNDPVPVHLDKRSTSLKLLQHLRNEAHRFAITFHRNQRSRGMFRSRLLEIPGIGEKTAKKLLKEYKSIKKIRELSPEELEKVIGPKLAQTLIKAFEENKL